MDPRCLHYNHLLSPLLPPRYLFRHVKSTFEKDLPRDFLCRSASQKLGINSSSSNDTLECVRMKVLHGLTDHDDGIRTDGKHFSIHGSLSCPARQLPLLASLQALGLASMGGAATVPRESVQVTLPARASKQPETWSNSDVATERKHASPSLGCPLTPLVGSTCSFYSAWERVAWLAKLVHQGTFWTVPARPPSTRYPRSIVMLVDYRRDVLDSVMVQIKEKGRTDLCRGGQTLDRSYQLSAANPTIVHGRRLARAPH
ncbi:hypothetical protein NM208_g13903 [Fusarium decemcellulare]|uniref:Uncharacterized protein n=1 Tax=Fusarium decemcellulare TaxID=57161 RepID=A0ACC1RJZ9_9HYPO|nr:hypothetical protein NM208_g13903 [Fusarium decemcellulare]